MGLGQGLQSGYEYVTVLMRDAVGVAELIGDDSGDHSLRSVGASVNQSLALLKRCRDNAVSKSNPVKEVLGSFEQLDARRGEIDGVARYLRAVALNIFIETSRSDISDENFSVIAGEIKTLSEEMIRVSKSIHELTVASKNRFEAMFTEISGGIVEITGLADLAEHSAGNSIEQIEELMGYSFGLVEDAERMSRGIFREVEKIVVGVQLHDSMRQRIEHIVSGLSEVDRLCNPETACLDSGQGRADDVATAHALIGLQRAQIEQLIADVDAVYGQTRVAMEGIVGDITQLTRYLTNMGDPAAARETRRDASEDPFGMLSSDLSNIRSLERRGADLESRLGEIYQKAFEAVSTLSSFTDDLHNISRESHNKALNTIIAANHLGTEGRSLSVLAKEMKSLSNQAEESIGAVETVISSVVDTIQGVELETLFNTGDDDSSSEASVVSMTLSLYEQIKERTAGLLEVSTKLITTFARAREALTFLPSLVEMLTRQRDQLDEANGLLAPWVDETATVRIPEHCLVDRYTMETERSVHMACMAGDTGGAASAPDGGGTFGSQGSEPGDDDDFGDNIELF
ncbi:hypothetical protein MSL71_22820 [Desulfoluna butyratoxydans]|uniref:Methyl-accepting chemotaxis protein (Mcp) signalling domain n=2 Tax=Desulfoluna butyratoxydans TaxID=231438 RepID=A0A4U8YTI0_9BACT|nr:hypothetical protein MSL71_22820 [Desulfoluna butyratoxydans]